MLVNDSNLSCCGRGFDSPRLHHFKKEKKEMYLEPALAMSLSIFLTITMFFGMYLFAYAIVSGAMFTTEKIKARVRREKDENNL
tara:strand:+ start:234 stop:485 length:252 start_codon:yes stop_codon:yes gene_type:complete